MKDFEKRFKEKLKEEVDSVEININPKSILNSYNPSFKEEKKEPWYKRKSFVFGGSFGLVALTATAVICSIFLFPRDSNNNKLIPENNAVMNKVCYELFSGISFMESKTSQPTYLKTKKNMNTKQTNNEFYDMSDYFYSFFPLIESVESYQESSSFYAPIPSDNKDYSYCVSINSIYKYYFSSSVIEDKKEVSNGLLVYNDTSYEVKVSSKQESDGDEIENEKVTTLYYSLLDYLVVEKEEELEEGESELSYCLSEYKDGKLFNKIEFELESDEKSFEVIKHNGARKDYEYEFGSIVNSSLYIDYQGKEEYENVCFNVDKKEFIYLGETYLPKNIL